MTNIVSSKRLVSPEVGPNVTFMNTPSGILDTIATPGDLMGHAVAGVCVSLTGDNWKRGVAELADRFIRPEIVTGILARGERLTEVHLSNELILSRTPMRDAIRRLILEGFNSRQGGYTTHVERFPDYEVKQAFDVKQTLDSYACECAAERVMEEDIAGMVRSRTLCVRIA